MINQLDFRDLECFAVLADTLHYGKAAEKLHITQSALSQKVQRLEALLGHSLLDRTNRKVALNHAGTSFRKEVDVILNQTKLSLERWRLGLEGTSGMIRIGFVGSAMQAYLPPIVKLFSKKYPAIKFTLEDLSNKDQIAALEKGMLDVGFIRSNIVPDTMSIKLVHKENFCLVLPKNHKVNKNNFRHLGQLQDDPFILFPNENSNKYFQLIVSMCEDQGFTPKITHRAIDGPTIFKLVESNLGVSIVPASLKNEKSYKVKFIELTQVKQKTELFCVWNKGSENAAVGYFLKII